MLSLCDSTCNSVQHSLRIVQSRYRPSAELSEVIAGKVNHHMDLVLTLDSYVGSRSWHHNCGLHIALTVTTWGWQN